MAKPVAFDLRPALARLRLRHFQLLDLLIDSGSISAAAQRLHVSQPVASQMVKDIELAFGGAPLFVRSASGVRPSDRLLALLRRTRAGLGEFQAAADVAAANRPITTLRLAGNFHSALNFLPRLVAQLYRLEPNLRISFVEGRAQQLIDDLTAGRLDAFIGRPPPELGRQLPALGVTEQALYSSTYRFVVGRQHPLARRRRIDLSELLEYPWALSERGGESRDLVDKAFLHANLPLPDPVLVCRPIYINLLVVATAPLVTVAAQQDAQRAQSQGLVSILPLDVPLQATPVVLLTRTTAHPGSLVELLRGAVATAMRQLEGAAARDAGAAALLPEHARGRRARGAAARSW